MIGAFARMFGDHDRLLEVAPADGSHDYTLTSRGDGTGAVTATSDAPPDAFVEKVAYDGGDVYVVPFIEQLKALLRRKRA